MIKVIDLDFNLLGEIDQFDSLIYTRKWRSHGDVQITITGWRDISLFQENNILFFSNNPKKSMYITHSEYTVGEDGKEDFLIKGKTLGSWLGQRITIPPVGLAYDKVSAAAETVMKQFVDRNAANPTDATRKISNLVIATDQMRGVDVVYQTRFKSLDSELEKLSIMSLLGWDITLDITNGQFVFEVNEGRDLRSTQSVNPPVIFSIDFDNIKSQKYVNSKIGYKNFGYVGGQGEGELRDIVTVGGGEGLDRFETFVDARDIEDPSQLPSRGEQKLSELKRAQSFEATVLPYSNFVYEVDWDLGDIVTVQNKRINVTDHLQITEVNEIYEIAGFVLEVVFGKALPNLVDVVKQGLDSPSGDSASGGQVVTSETYTHSQIAPSSSWSITHNLDKHPSVTVVDSGGNTVLGDVKYVDSDNIVILFNASFSGKAYLN